jgi:hypothetical protein
VEALESFKLAVLSMVPPWGLTSTAAADTTTPPAEEVKPAEVVSKELEEEKKDEDGDDRPVNHWESLIEPWVCTPDIPVRTHSGIPADDFGTWSCSADSIDKIASKDSKSRDKPKEVAEVVEFDTTAAATTTPAELPGSVSSPPPLTTISSSPTPLTAVQDATDNNSISSKIKALSLEATSTFDKAQEETKKVKKSLLKMMGVKTTHERHSTRIFQQW